MVQEVAGETTANIWVRAEYFIVCCCYGCCCCCCCCCLRLIRIQVKRFPTIGETASSIAPDDWLLPLLCHALFVIVTLSLHHCCDAHRGPPSLSMMTHYYYRKIKADNYFYFGARLTFKF